MRWDPENLVEHARLRNQIAGNLHVFNAQHRALVEDWLAHPHDHDVEVLDEQLPRPESPHGTETGLRIDSLVLWVPTGWIAIPPEAVN